MYTRIFISLFFITINSQLHSQIYVAASGNDFNPGTKDLPFQTITKALSISVMGDTIYVRGETYSINSTIIIDSVKSGTEDSKCYLFAYPGERPLLDFTGTESGKRGISLKASYWYIKGFDIFGAGDNGMEINAGSNNTIEFCSFYDNEDTGLQLSNGASDNRIINCDSYYNADPPDYGDADGFAPKLTCGSGNYFYGCRAWGNVDDGWDGYLRGTDSITTTLENCWTWGNGYLKNGTDPGSKANGNGFKLGGGDNSNSLKLMHNFILKNCLSFDNKAKGFDQNNNTGSMILLNCTAYNNKSSNYKITMPLNPGQVLIVKNCISFGGNPELGSFADLATNSWMSPFNISTEDFLSIDSSPASTARKNNGTLPYIDFLHLAVNSDLVDVGLSYNGKAPDLGAFETSPVSFVDEKININRFELYQNYPNPFNPTTKIKFYIPATLALLSQKSRSDREGVTGGEPGGALTQVTLKVFDILGQEVAVLINEHKTPGYYKVEFNAGNLSTGIYIYRLTAGNYTASKKLMLIK